jgi:NTE family protein
LTSLAKRLKGKRVGVALAAGFFGFYHHAGVLVALARRDIRPVRITGTSAGALTASMFAAGMEPEAIGDYLLGLERDDFWDMQWPLTRLGVGLLAGHRFRGRLGQVLPVHSFEACPVPFAVGVYNLAQGRVAHMSTGPLIPAVYASCAFPYLLSPIEIDGVRYWDGGFGEKTPLVPFLADPDLDTVFVSYLPASGDQREGIKEFLPSLSSMFAFSPRDERIERDRASVGLLREAGLEVLVFAPPRVKLGPFSLDRAKEAFDQGREATLTLLDSDVTSVPGSPDLS